MEYQPLFPSTGSETSSDFSRIRHAKEVFNLPFGCEVHFDDRVIDIFADQSLDPSRATRHNIGRILIHLYLKLVRRLGHRPSRREIDHNLLLGRDFYKRVFGSFKSFERLVNDEVRRIVSFRL